ncbi:hypothetical protein PVK06_039825 [Gossypium arboreum]|uniref:Uncharacterized protein n=1 Tax=Gossypium arboreum TaxID=29729 RepID=A0ABR0N3W1_GOSAR|nr:hypothetical protein PVK06_039825 [Gossypium arboreum]
MPYRLGKNATCTCHAYLDNKCLLTTQAKARKGWKKYDDIGCCYVLASMTNTLYKQLESYKIAKAILDKLEDMF